MEILINKEWYDNYIKKLDELRIRISKPASSGK